MTTSARLLPVHVPSAPDAAVVVLHGGGSRAGSMPVSPTQLSVLRMVPIAHRIVRAGNKRLAVWRLLNSVRGWDGEHTPVVDLRWALDEIRAALPVAVPVGLVGHSLGGRAAILGAGEHGVRSVVALAPWVYPDDGDVDATGRRVLVVHGTSDRIASLSRATAAAQRLARTAQVGMIRVEGGKHAMIRHHGIFDTLAAEFTAATLLDRPPSDPAGPLAQILAGAPIATA